MKLSLEVVNSAGQILSGFNSATTVTLGDLTLPVKVGPMTQQVLFLIVEDGVSLVALDESHPRNLPQNGKLFN